MIKQLLLLAAIVSVPTLARADTPPESINLRRTIVVDVAEHTKDAVVYISTQKLVSQRFGFGGQPMWEERVPGGSLGSGFIVHPDGYIITNNHVIDRARAIEVELLDGRKLPADLISSDPEADLAVLKVDAKKPLPTLELGDSSDILVGEPVIAVGNPLGFSHSVSSGIISALHRDLKTDDGQQVILGDLIQTDAAINHGNSGGPLLNAYGKVIGVNTAIRADAQNIGFAIQVNKLRDMIPLLMDPAQANKLDVPIKLKEKRKVVAPNKVESTLTLADASEAPIATIAGQTPRDIVDAYAILLNQKDGALFELKLADGSTKQLTPHARPTPDAIVQAKDRLGIVVEELSPMTAQKYGLVDEEGMLITAVKHGSIAEKAGLHAGDVIIALARYPVTSLKQFSNLMQYLPESGNVRVFISRSGQRGWTTLKL